MAESSEGRVESWITTAGENMRLRIVWTDPKNWFKAVPELSRILQDASGRLQIDIPLKREYLKITGSIYENWRTHAKIEYSRSVVPSYLRSGY